MHAISDVKELSVGSYTNEEATDYPHITSYSQSKTSFAFLFQFCLSEHSGGELH